MRPKGSLGWSTGRMQHLVSRFPRGYVHRILAARMSPPVDTGLLHWSSREMAAFISRTENVNVSHLRNNF
jgi:hypothetical protein